MAFMIPSRRPSTKLKRSYHMTKVLVVDDDPVILEVIGEILRTNGYDVVAAPNGQAGINELDNDYYDLVLTDLMMPEIDGMEVLNNVVTKSPKTMCIVLTGYGTINSSVEAIKRGAFDYITKPITPNELVVVIEKALKYRNLQEENVRLKREVRQKYQYNNLIGTSSAIEKIYSLIDKVADTDSTVLISGASGTGRN